MWWKQMAYFLVAKKQRDGKEGSGNKTHLQRHALMPLVTGFLWEATPPGSLSPTNPSRVNLFMKLELSFYPFTYAQLFRDQPSTQEHLRSLGNSRHLSTLCLHREQRQYSLTALCSGSAPSETQRPASILRKGMTEGEVYHCRVISW